MRAKVKSLFIKTAQNPKKNKDWGMNVQADIKFGASLKCAS